jgi:hypothetical protein
LIKDHFDQVARRLRERSDQAACALAFQIGGLGFEIGGNFI